MNNKWEDRDEDVLTIEVAKLPEGSFVAVEILGSKLFEEAMVYLDREQALEVIKYLEYTIATGRLS